MLFLFYKRAVLPILMILKYYYLILCSTLYHLIVLLKTIAGLVSKSTWNSKLLKLWNSCMREEGPLNIIELLSFSIKVILMTKLASSFIPLYYVLLCAECWILQIYNRMQCSLQYRMKTIYYSSHVGMVN